MPLIARELAWLLFLLSFGPLCRLYLSGLISPEDWPALMQAYAPAVELLSSELGWLSLFTVWHFAWDV